MYLYSNVSGSPNNANQTLLGQATPLAVFGTTNNSVVSFAVAGSVPVTAGTSYWLVLKPATNGLDVWNSAFPTVVGKEDQSLDDSAWYDTGYNFLPAFRLSATASASVPDSGNTFFLFLGVVATLIALQQKQRFGKALGAR